ncbi:MAG: UvrD-helicase domain-containing protein [Labilithrix sp.]|nr:UvrD-helicase domain-containing protein [Labilithrix sp.]
MSGAGITIVGASAGSGKTYRLTQEVTAAVGARGDERVDLSGLVAVTFTKKAHTELEARIRHKLVSEQAYDEALRLPLAYLGTVHAAALRLLQEFALDAGLSPSVDVVAGSETKLLRQAFERSLDEEARGELDELAARLELRIDHRTRRADWVTPVADIMDLARSNRIAPAELPAMAERSVERLLALLPHAEADATELDSALARELDAAVTALTRSNDGRKNTADALTELERARKRLADGELRWSGWAKLATVAPSKACAGCVEDLRAVAARYEAHPRLHDDLRRTTRAVFGAARAGLVAYQDWKKERRVVDYVDMLDGALSLVEHPRVRAELARRLRFVVVDEFQDTSPIQLALFVRLHSLAGRSVWVGDRKQCIFEYAGADPILMDTVAGWVEREGGARDRLGDNHRSRPELVEACSELFAAALARHGFAREEVVVRARRPAHEGLAQLPPFGLWALDVANKDDDAEAVAEGVRRTLETPHTTPIVDRASGEVRPVRPGDIAILVTTNAWAAELAVALHARGVRAAIARAGLFETPEGTLVDASLRWLLDESDVLAGAVIDALTGWGGQGPDAWLTERLRDVAQRAAATGGAPGGEVAGGEREAEAEGVRQREVVLDDLLQREAGDDDVGDEDDGESPPNAELAAGWRGALGALRSRLTILSPAEALDATLAALDVVHLCARWPDPAQRIANLDALRAAAASYEARSAQEREAATVAGMLRYFDDMRSPTLQRDEILPSDDQHLPADDGAVVICTYHKAKGLEWPVVVLTDLDRGERRDAFEVTPESLGETFDPDHPLANRAIRYWPWPLGSKKNAPLADAAAQSDEGRLVALREEKERARLLYVGFTRARDHLVLAARVSRGGAKTAWLDALADAEGAPLVELPASAADGAVDETRIRLAGSEALDAGARALGVSTRVLRLGADRPEMREDAPLPVWFARPAGATPAVVAREATPVAAREATAMHAPWPPYRITPSAGASDWPELAARVARSRIGVVERLPSAIALDGRSYADDVLGNAVHAFLAADVEGLTPETRLERARALVEGWGVMGVVRAESLVRAGDTLRAWVEQRWPGARWHREIAIEGTVASEHGERRVSGIIDLLLETDAGYVVVDHKTFPGSTPAAWRAKCGSFIAQLAAYAIVLESAGGKCVEACWIHLPVGGGMVEVVLGAAGEAGSSTTGSLHKPTDRLLQRSRL